MSKLRVLRLSSNQLTGEGGVTRVNSVPLEHRGRDKICGHGSRAHFAEGESNCTSGNIVGSQISCFVDSQRVSSLVRVPSYVGMGPATRITRSTFYTFSAYRKFKFAEFRGSCPANAWVEQDLQNWQTCAGLHTRLTHEPIEVEPKFL